ncbi:MAG: Holliday junction branch migration protein RuvA [Alphaproteobacteria bacterium]
MIAKLTGILDATGEDWAVIDVGGVGYLVFGSGRTLAGLGAVGRPVSLLIETHVREDHIHLYGFEEGAERDWFRLLTTVQGVGARVALAILTVLPPVELAQVIAARDRAALAQANGVGAKLAGRILGELNDRVGELAMGAVAPVAPGAGDGAGVGAGALAPEGAAPEAVSALVNLGYKRGQAFAAVAGAARRLGADAPVEELIRAGLKELGLGVKG